MEGSSAESFDLKILVAKDENKVIMAESNKEFVEVLFSFMLVPVASAISRTSDCSSREIGCLENLYRSVKNLDMKFLCDESFRDILLNPRSIREIISKNLGIDMLASGCYVYYVCDNKYCKAISWYKFGLCRCGRAFKYSLEVAPGSTFFPEVKGGLLKSSARFIITDDFRVMPVATMGDVTLLSELGQYGKAEERTIRIGRNEVLGLLRRSLVSRTPLSETFLNLSIDKSSNIELLNMKHRPLGMDPSFLVTNMWNRKPKISIKLIVDKVKDTVLYAVAEEDFVNMLCTFLTFPLGYIFNQFPRLSFEGCMGNLHKSIRGTDANMFFHQARKEMLVNTMLPQGLAYPVNLIGIEEATISSELPTFSPLLNAKCNNNANSGNPKGAFYGFIKRPTTFLVMDDLEVEPLSPISVKHLLDKLMVPLSHIGEQKVVLDEFKAMHLLAASLASKQALTSAFLCNDKNVENVDCSDFLQLLWGGKRSGSKDS